MNHNKMNLSTYLNLPLKSYDEISILAQHNSHLYLMNAWLTAQNRLVYIDCTSSSHFDETPIKFLDFPNNLETDKFISYGDIKPTALLTNHYIVLTDEKEVRNLITKIKNPIHPPVRFANGDTVKQNYLKVYGTTPVHYQIIISNNRKRKEGSIHTFEINYRGEVRVEHYKAWKSVFSVNCDSYYQAFTLCEKFIKEHMQTYPVYDNE